MSNKLIGQKKGAEFFAEESRLFEYGGDDRIVSSHELAKELEKTEDSSFIIPTGVKALDDIHEGGIEAGEVWVFSGPGGEGKSLAKGTQVLMYDGRYKKIEDVQVGEKMMGKDSTPRTVLNTGNGTEEMFKVTPVRGESFVCNKSHILSVVKYKQRKTGGKKWLEPRYETVHLADYLKYSETQKKLTMLYRAAIDWEQAETPVEPYLLGLWLGDGHSSQEASLRFSHSNEDVELTAYHQAQGATQIQDKRNKTLTHSYSTKSFPRDAFPNEKHIPHDYKVNSRAKRLELLAGLIDSDGYTNRTGYVFCNKSERLAEDVLFVARSLGFFAQKKEFTGRIKSIGFEGRYWKVYISGNCSIIPVKIARKKVPPRKMKKNILWTGIKSVETIGIGKYYGVSLDGDHEYLLSDFTVTHNTTLTMTITQNMAKMGVKTTWFTLEVTPRQFIKKMQGRGELPLFYLPNENKDPLVQWLEERILEAKVKFNARVVFIDHLQQIFSIARMEKPSQNLSWEIGDLMAKIKQIAVLHDIAICLIVHTKDDPTGSAREPRKEDLRDSGLVSRLADSIVLIWRVPNADEITSTRRKVLDEDDIKAKVRCVKNRRVGKLATWFMNHEDHYLTESIYENRTDF